MESIQLTLIVHGLTLAQKRGCFADDEPLLEPTSVLPPSQGQLLCGPERRARESAALLGQYRVCEALRDIDCGHWRGEALNRLALTQPQAVAQWLKQPDFNGHGGESVIEAMARLGAWMDALEPGAYTAVTHPGVVRVAVLYALGAEAQRFNHLDIAPWARVRLNRRGEWKVLLVG